MTRPRPLSLCGAVFGVVALCASVLPSLVPRAWSTQVILGGACLAAAYAIGAFAGWAYRALQLPALGPRWRTRAWLALAVLTPVALLLLGVLGRGWQLDQREAIGMAGEVSWLWVVASLLGVLFAVVLLGAARGLRWVALAAGRAFGRVLPARFGVALAITLTAFATWALVRGAVTDRLLPQLDALYAGLNDQSGPGVTNPSSPYRSAGPASSVSWDSLGQFGRQFVWQGQTAADIARVTGDDAAIEPIRAYVGLEAGDGDDAERAELAVAELRRLGGFTRKRLAVAGTTGRGWVEPRTAAALEFVSHGDVATVAMQYSYLPSPVSFVVDQERAKETSRALITAIRVELATMPESERPELYVLGESLGAFATDSAFTSVEDLSTTTDGAMLVGPPGFDPVFRRLQDRRDAGSPTWRPVYRGGALARVGSTASDLTKSGLTWTTKSRVIYLVHATDPIVAYGGDRSAWLDPHGPGVPSLARNLPLVGFLQNATDQIGATAPPSGYGHTYDEAVVDAWSQVLGPPELPAAELAAIRRAVAPIADPE